jgi:alpha-N-acetylglucosamine transferase
MYFIAFQVLKLLRFQLWLIAIIFEYAYRKAFEFHYYFGLLMLIYFGVLVGLKMNIAVQVYADNFSPDQLDNTRIESSKEIKKHSQPNVAVMTNVDLTTEQMYYAHHSISPIAAYDTAVINDVLNNAAKQYSEIIITTMVPNYSH